MFMAPQPRVHVCGLAVDRQANEWVAFSRKVLRWLSGRHPGYQRRRKLLVQPRLLPIRMPVIRVVLATLRAPAATDCFPTGDRLLIRLVVGCVLAVDHVLLRPRMSMDQPD